MAEEDKKPETAQSGQDYLERKIRENAACLPEEAKPEIPVQPAALMSDDNDWPSMPWNDDVEMPGVMYGEELVIKKGTPLPAGERRITPEELVAALRTVEDPELMVNVYDLGLIYKSDVQDNGDVDVDITVTAPTCPVAGMMPQMVADAVSAVKGTGVVTVKLVWEPVWTPDRMTQEARFILDRF